LGQLKNINILEISDSGLSISLQTILFLHVILHTQNGDFCSGQQGRNSGYQWTPEYKYYSSEE
jgi:hypothetical protein